MKEGGGDTFLPTLTAAGRVMRVGLADSLQVKVSCYSSRNVL